MSDRLNKTFEDTFDQLSCLARGEGASLTVWWLTSAYSLLLIGVAESGRSPDNARSYFKDGFYSEFTEQPLLAFVQTFQWGHWQVVFKSARKHSWQVCSRAKCSFLYNTTPTTLRKPWQGWRNRAKKDGKKDISELFKQEYLSFLCRPCFCGAFNWCATANTRCVKMV